MPLSRLNDEQKQAATANLGHNLIIASAGTGKTSTIVARIAYLLQNKIKPSEILLLTFTNKAASEMVQRLGQYFSQNIIKEIEAGTFHAVSYRLLKKLGKNIAIKQPRELKTLLKTLLDKRRFDYTQSAKKAYQAGYLYDLFSLYKNSVLNLSFSQWIKTENQEQGVFGEIYEDVLDEFEKEKKKFGYVDFNDLLIMMKNELKKGAKVYFREILIDEYQDTNPLQNSLVEAFEANSLFCVGDYDQSIYAFNGADIKIIGSFSERYANAEIFSLNKNYRSSHLILSLANKVIQNNPRLYPKKLEVTRVGEFESPKLFAFGEVFEQYQQIALKISQSKTPHEQIAVIFRNNSSGDGIEANLRELRINSKRKGGISFFDSKEVKALIDLITLCINSKDMMSFIHIFSYAKGAGAALCKDIFDGLFKLGNGDFLDGLLNPDANIQPFEKRRQNTQLGLFDDFSEFGSLSKFNSLNLEESFLANPVLKHPKLSIDAASFLYELYKFAKSAKKIKAPQSLINHAINSSIFTQISQSLATKRATKKDGSVDNNQKLEAMERILQKGQILLNLAKNYSQSERFLNALTLGSNEMSQGEGVNLLSVHASKGLEFSEVYVIDLMDGRFPNRKLMKMSGSLEEERRLFYVASTRAKDKLILSYAKFDKIKRQDYIHSQFISEAGLVK